MQTGPGLQRWTLLYQDFAPGPESTCYVHVQNEQEIVLSPQSKVQALIKQLF